MLKSWRAGQGADTHGLLQLMTAERAPTPPTCSLPAPCLSARHSLCGQPQAPLHLRSYGAKQTYRCPPALFSPFVLSQLFLLPMFEPTHHFCPLVLVAAPSPSPDSMAWPARAICSAPNTDVASHNKRPPLPENLMNWLLFSQPFICLLQPPLPLPCRSLPLPAPILAAQRQPREGERNYLLCAC